MATLKRQAQQNDRVSTNEKDMRADAVAYARRDASTVIEVFKTLFPKKFENEEIEEATTSAICNALVDVKYKMIVESRTKKPMWDKFLNEAE